jgi:hypothetical protein
MTTRTFTTKSGNVFEWEETEEVNQAVEQLHKQNETKNDTKTANVV